MMGALRSLLLLLLHTLSLSLLGTLEGFNLLPLQEGGHVFFLERSPLFCSSDCQLVAGKDKPSRVGGGEELSNGIIHRYIRTYTIHTTSGQAPKQDLPSIKESRFSSVHELLKPKMHWRFDPVDPSAQVETGALLLFPFQVDQDGWSCF